MSEERLPSRSGTGTGGSQGAPTNWNSYGLDQIWQMVDGEDGSVSWAQYDAWRRMAALCDDQAGQLATALAQLGRHWPPRPGSASYAFATWVDALVASMRQSAEAGRRNQSAIYEITVALGSARAEVAGLVEQAGQYASEEQQLLLPQPLPSSGSAPPPAATAVPRPPHNWRAALDQQAQDVMARTDATVGAQAQAIQIPPEFDMQLRYDSGSVFDPDPGQLSGGAGFRMPDMSHLAPPPPAPGLSPSYAFGPALGDGLGGVASEPPQPPPIWPGVPGVLLAPPGRAPAATSFEVLPGGLVRSQGRVTSALKASGGGREAPARIGTNPADRATTKPTAAPMSLIPQAGARSVGSNAALSGGGGRRSSGSWRRRRSPDPTDPWAAPSGGCSVLEPTPEVPDHSPGPGVIGHTP